MAIPPTTQYGALSNKNEKTGEELFRKRQLGSVRSFRPVASPLTDVDYAGMMKKAIHDIACDRVVAEGDPPFLQADPGGHDQSNPILACTHQIQQQARILVLLSDKPDMVDDQKIETVFELLAAGLASQICDRRVRIVVDVERVLREAIKECTHLPELLLGEFPLLELPCLDAKQPADDAIHQRLLCHLE